MSWTVEQLINDRKQYSEAVLEAVKEFARSKPYRGTNEERQAKYEALHVKLCAAYGIEITLQFVSIVNAPLGGFTFDDQTNVLTLTGKLSVVNYLHAFTAARGCGKRERFAWSLNLFKRCFPRSFERAEKVGPCLVQPGTMTRLRAQLEADREREAGDSEREAGETEERDESGDL
jgi:hypothetical protein